MKKLVLLAALVCGISFAGNASTLKVGLPTVVSKQVASSKLVNPARVYELYEMEFTCPAQGWTIPVVGNSKREMLDAFDFYLNHLDC